MLKWLIELWAKTKCFFPIVLLFSHLKHNLIGLLYWVLLTGIVSDRIGSAYGIPLLFLSPEYQGEVGGWSYFFVGFAIGGLTMAFHSYSYVRIGPKFPFLAMVNKPFVRFCINNSIIPIVFSIIYISQIIDFQREEEFATIFEVICYSLAYLVGFSAFVMLSIAYFFPANKNLFDLFFSHQEANNAGKWNRLSQGKTLRYSKLGKHPLYWYIGRSFKVQQCRSTRHYSAELLQQVFAQNRISTTIFEMATVTTFILLGLAGGKAIFDVPAGMSMVMLLTILLMIFSALLAWLKSWTYLLLIVLVLFVDWGSKHFDVFQLENRAYGMNYDTPKVNRYNQRMLEQFSRDESQIMEDSLDYIDALNDWKRRTGEDKPVMFIVNTSGGGSRSAAWVYEVLRHNDSLTGGKFSKHCTLITGASGGMIGAAFYRSLLLRKMIRPQEVQNQKANFEAISSDLLNKLTFAATTNDLFLRMKHRKIGRYKYQFDRGMAFEADLNENTFGLLDHSMGYYKRLEAKGLLPVMIFSPTILNDGRRLLLSSQPLSFLSAPINEEVGITNVHENVDAHQLLGKGAVNNLRFTSALRMNATFPFVLPMVTLPTTPAIQLQDAGTRDNFGVKTTMRWLAVFEQWLKENTSGVVVVQIRDTRRILKGEVVKTISFLDKLTLPVTNVFSNFPRTQDFDQEELTTLSLRHSSFPVQMISFNLRELSKDRISLSFHLTTNEKEKIKQAIRSKKNVMALREVQSFFEEASSRKINH